MFNVIDAAHIIPMTTEQRQIIRDTQDRLGAFLDEFYASTKPLYRGWLARCTAKPRVVVELFQDDNLTIFISMIRVNRVNRRKGYASQVVKWLCSLADKHKVDLVLEAAPIGNPLCGPGYAELQEWYLRYGFSGERFLTRKPLLDLTP